MPVWRTAGLYSALYDITPVAIFKADPSALDCEVPWEWKWSGDNTVELYSIIGRTPVKDPHTRMKPLDLASGNARHTHGRYTRAGACVRWGMAVTSDCCKCETVSLPKRFRNGRFTSETAVLFAATD